MELFYKQIKKHYNKKQQISLKIHLIKNTLKIF